MINKNNNRLKQQIAYMRNGRHLTQTRPFVYLSVVNFCYCIGRHSNVIGMRCSTTTDRQGHNIISQAQRGFNRSDTKNVAIRCSQRIVSTNKFYVHF